MQLKDVMTRGVEVVRPDSTLQEAASKMKTLDVGPMPVCEGDKVIGMITDRDIVVRAVAEGRDPRMTHVRDAMSNDVVFCYEDQDLDEAGRIMKQRQIRRLVIMSRQEKLVGIVSLGDLAVEGMSDKRAGDVLEGVSEPTRPGSKARVGNA